MVSQETPTPVDLHLNAPSPFQTVQPPLLLLPLLVHLLLYLGVGEQLGLGTSSHDHGNIIRIQGSERSEVFAGLLLATFLMGSLLLQPTTGHLVGFLSMNFITTALSYTWPQALAGEASRGHSMVWCRQHCGRHDVALWHCGSTCWSHTPL